MKVAPFILSLLFFQLAFSQKNMTLKDCEDAMQKNNFQLLAEQYNITAAQAAVIQARIWDHPNMSLAFNALNPEDKRYFDVGKNGQKAVAVDQLIHIGGKKRNEIKLAKSNVALAELQFEELMQDLKHELRQSFYAVFFDQKKIASIESQTAQIQSLLESYEIQADKGNVPLKDVVRLQSLLLNLKNDRIAIQKDITENKQKLNILTGIDEELMPSADESELMLTFNSPKYAESELFNIAKEKNPEYLSVLKQVENQELAVKLQKSLSVPDITAGLAYDQVGGAFKNEVNFTLGIPLPLWNRNKGNIKIAEAELGQSKVNKDQKTLELKTQVNSSLSIWKEQQKEYTSLSKSINENLDLVYKGVLMNFQRRNISLLEFTDFMESYNQSTLQLNEMRKQLILSGEQINHITNSTIF
jgi:cobalt-zinc-cadmium efflux system outer membrane protein